MHFSMTLWTSGSSWPWVNLIPGKLQPFCFLEIFFIGRNLKGNKTIHLKSCTKKEKVTDQHLSFNAQVLYQLSGDFTSKDFSRDQTILMVPTPYCLLVWSIWYVYWIRRSPVHFFQNFLDKRYNCKGTLAWPFVHAIKHGHWSTCIRHSFKC